MSDKNDNNIDGKQKDNKNESKKLAAVFLGSAIIYPLLHIAFTVAKARAKK